MNALGDIAVFHIREGAWIAAGAVCPHRQGLIVDSICGAGRLQCPIHGYSFDVVTGESNSPDVGRLKIFRVSVENNSVWIENE